jgi:(2R)-3-sulfolactate dehydrogenase (NADP+)
MAKVNLGSQLQRAQSLLERAGLSSDLAATSARAIVASDRWGIGSHGLMRLPFYLERLQAGGINPSAQLRSVTDLPSLVIYDGENGLGHWQIHKAAEVATERAVVNGIAAVGIGASSHCGALGIYTAPITRTGLVGIIFSNGPAVMPPWGGHAPVLSTSPIAAGVPTNPPTVIDMATSAVARGKIAAKAQLGEPLDPGWAFTAKGQPTTDAKEALSGMLAPLGGAKGYALAVLVESLTGALIGPTLAAKVPDMFARDAAARPQGISHFVIAIDAKKLSVDGDTSRLSDFVALVDQAGGRMPGSNRVDPENLNNSDEIEVADGVLQELSDWDAKLSS